MIVDKIKLAALTVLASGLAVACGGLALSQVAAPPRGGTAAVQSGAREPAPAPEAAPAGPSKEYRLGGSVRLEGTGEPIAGATIDVMTADSGERHRGTNQVVRSGPDGRYSVDLPPGSARMSPLIPPVGYWAPRDPRPFEEFAVSEETPVHSKDYVVRRGTVWDFAITRGRDAAPPAGAVFAFDERGIFRSVADGPGRVRLTLPTEGGTVTVSVRESPTASEEAARLTLEWTSGFRPDRVAAVTSLAGAPAQYRLTDDQGKTATLVDAVTAHAQPRLDSGKLAIAVPLPEPDPKAVGELTGKVVDGTGRPIAGALVALIWVEASGASRMLGQDEHAAVTDARGEFRLRSIPRSDAAGKPPTLQLAVTKEGFAGVDTKPVRFQPAQGAAAQAVPDVRLAPGVAVRGTVVDADGRPLAGVWIEPGGSYANRSRFTKTDDAGRFTVRDLPAGMVRLGFHYGSLMADGKYLAAADADPLKVTLRPAPGSGQAQARAAAAKAAAAKRKPAARGTPAPEWTLGAWSDGRPRTLADCRGKVVVLSFWGTWCAPCVQELPALEKLRAKYEPLGVVFLAIHTPAEADAPIRKVLDLKKAKLVFAVDAPRGNDKSESNGVTAERYGVGGYPTNLIIDRAGKIAYRSNDRDNQAAIQQAVRELGLDPKTIDEEQASRLVERVLDRAIDRVLNPRDR